MTPTATVLGAAAPLSTTDAGGRTIMVRRLNALDKLRLLKAAGPILSDNQAWLGIAMLAASVVELDGIPLPTPINEQQIEASVSRLGDSGLDAVANALVVSDDSDQATLGNSSGTPI